MIKLSKMTDYFIFCLVTLTLKQWELMSISYLSKGTASTLVKVQKLLKLLVSKGDFIKANRGSLGGYILSRNSLGISIVEITEPLDGPTTLISSVDKSESTCETSDVYIFGGKWNKIKEIIRKSLNKISSKNLLGYENSILIDDNKKILMSRIN